LEKLRQQINAKLESEDLSKALESLFEVRPLNIIVLPIRPGRREPRVKKRGEKPYPYMIKPRAELKVMLKNQQFKA
jgi:hypothetical protein